MSTIYLREYAEADIPTEPGITDQTIASSGASASSSAFNARTAMLAISTGPTQAVACLFGAAPTALVTSLRLPANGIYFFRVSPGQKVAVIDVA